ncbi:MAG: hypothetical protein WA692_15290, partial [Paraburkholderia caledonica]
MTSRNASTCLRFIVFSGRGPRKTSAEVSACHIRNEWKPFLALFDRMICERDTGLDQANRVKSMRPDALLFHETFRCAPYWWDAAPPEVAPEPLPANVD